MLLSTGQFFGSVVEGEPLLIPDTFYAAATKSGNQINTTGVITFTGSEISDEQGLHNPASNDSRFVVPAHAEGRYARMWGNFYGEVGAVGAYWTAKNGSTYSGYGRMDTAATSATSEGVNLCSAPVLVSAGDYFEIACSFTGTVEAGTYTWGMLEILPETFSGALVQNTTTQNLPANTTTTVTFDQEIYDHNSYHDTGANTDRLTVPSGVSLVRLNFNAFLTADATNFALNIFKNGAAVHGTCQPDGDSVSALCMCTAPIAVSAGDYFTARAFNGSVSARTLEAFSSFSIEALPSDLKYALVKRITNQTLSANIATKILWTAEEADVGGWHDTDRLHSRLTVPAGVFKVRVGFGIRTEATHTGWLYASIGMNGESFNGRSLVRMASANEDTATAWSSIIDVTEGDYFEVTVIAENGCDIGSSTSSWFAIEEVLMEPIAAPTNTTDPYIDGDPGEGETLSVYPGRWKHATSFTYQWKDDGVSIGGATSNTYTLTSSEVGGAITCEVTAYNSLGSTSETTAATDAVTSGDPYFSLVSGLLHLNGVDGSTTFTDVKGNTWTGAGNAQIDTAESVFGGASLLLDGTGDYLSTPNNAKWQVGSDDFFIEARVRHTKSVSALCSKRDSGGAEEHSILLTSTNINGTVWQGGVPLGSVNVNGHNGLSTWSAVAFGRRGTDLYVFCDGLLQGKLEDVSGAASTNTGVMYIGRDGFDFTRDFAGHIDEFRFTKGRCRHIRDYTIASAAFPDS